MRALPSTQRRGFTLVEVMVASAILGAALIVMFGFHSQAVRSNLNARRLTDCTYLAQTQMERLLAQDWETSNRPTDLSEGMQDDTWMGTESWEKLTWPATALLVNAAFQTDTVLGPVLYSLSWDIEDMDDDATWARVRVRCTYDDAAFDTTHGTTISSFRFRDS